MTSSTLSASHWPSASTSSTRRRHARDRTTRPWHHRQPQDRTEDVKSVATQRDLVTAFAASRGWTLDEKHIFAHDGISGALFAERPGLQALPPPARRRCCSRS